VANIVKLKDFLSLVYINDFVCIDEMEIELLLNNNWWTYALYIG